MVSRGDTRRGSRSAGRRRSRGQAHTLEGVVAALLLLASLVFALQSTAVTPLSASTSSQHIENQEHSMANGLLAVAEDDGALETALVYWDEDNESFHGIRGGGYSNDGDFPSGFTLGAMLNETFSDRGIAYNIHVTYQTTTGEARTRRLVFRGNPSDNAVTTTRIVTLYDDTHLREKDETWDPLTVSDSAAEFYMPDAATSSDVYNVVRIELTVWRM